VRREPRPSLFPARAKVARQTVKTPEIPRKTDFCTNKGLGLQNSGQTNTLRGGGVRWISVSRSDEQGLQATAMSIGRRHLISSFVDTMRLFTVCLLLGEIGAMKLQRIEFTIWRQASACVFAGVFFAIGCARLSPDPVTTVTALAGLATRLTAHG
jgi:hypothetical protein